MGWLQAIGKELKRIFSENKKDGIKHMENWSLTKVWMFDGFVERRSWVVRFSVSKIDRVNIPKSQAKRFRAYLTG